MFGKKKSASRANASAETAKEATSSSQGQRCSSKKANSAKACK